MSPGLVCVPFLARCFMISLFVRDVGSVGIADTGNQTATATAPRTSPAEDAGALLVTDLTPSEPWRPPPRRLKGEQLNFQDLLAEVLREPGGTPVVAAVHMGQRILAMVLLLFFLFIAGPRVCC